MIDHEGPTPLYVQVADARGTARKSIQLLRERGLVVTVVGRGTFVALKQQAPEAQATASPADRRRAERPELITALPKATE